MISRLELKKKEFSDDDNVPISRFRPKNLNEITQSHSKTREKDSATKIMQAKEDPPKNGKLPKRKQICLTRRSGKSQKKRRRIITSESDSDSESVIQQRKEGEEFAKFMSKVEVGNKQTPTATINVNSNISTEKRMI